MAAKRKGAPPPAPGPLNAAQAFFLEHNDHLDDASAAALSGASPAQVAKFREGRRKTTAYLRNVDNQRPGVFAATGGSAAVSDEAAKGYAETPEQAMERNKDKWYRIP